MGRRQRSDRFALDSRYVGRSELVVRAANRERSCAEALEPGPSLRTEDHVMMPAVRGFVKRPKVLVRARCGAMCRPHHPVRARQTSPAAQISPPTMVWGRSGRLEGLRRSLRAPRSPPAISAPGPNLRLDRAAPDTPLPCRPLEHFPRPATRDPSAGTRPRGLPESRPPPRGPAATPRPHARPRPATLHGCSTDRAPRGPTPV